MRTSKKNKIHGFTLIELPAVRHGFTLIELLVVIAIISLLVSILLPSLTKAKEIAATVVCATNLKNVCLGFEMYLDEFSDGRYPKAEPRVAGGASYNDGDWWFTPIARRVGYDNAEGTNWVPRHAQGGVLWCPEHLRSTDQIDNRFLVSYSLPYYLEQGRWYRNRFDAVPIGGDPRYGDAYPARRDSIKTPGCVTLLTECVRFNGWGASALDAYGSGATEQTLGRHGGIGETANFLFADGHVESLTDGDALYAQWLSGIDGRNDAPFNMDLE